MSSAVHDEPSESLGAPSVETSEGLNAAYDEPSRLNTSTWPRNTEIQYDSQMHVDLVQSRADDMTVINAARVSTTGAEGSQKVSRPGQAGLIDYLMKNRHGSPFEHNVFTFFVRAPIFVIREFQRHRHFSYNEESGRYKELEPHFWVPPVTRKLSQVGKSSHYELVPSSLRQMEVASGACEAAYRAAWESYQDMLAEGVAREVARVVLPVSIYSSMYATCNARALMHFLSLRTDYPGSKYPSKPMAEINQVASQMELWFEEKMPLTYEAFNMRGRVAP